MKSLLKLAVGAAIAGALVNLLLKQQRSGKDMDGQGLTGSDRMEGAEDQPENFTPTELVADTQSVGEGSGDDRVQLPDDGRVAQGPLN